MVKRKLDGAVDKFSVDREIRKSDTIVHNLWKICIQWNRVLRQAGRQNLG